MFLSESPAAWSAVVAPGVRYPSGRREQVVVGRRWWAGGAAQPAGAPIGVTVPPGNHATSVSCAWPPPMLGMTAAREAA